MNRFLLSAVPIALAIGVFGTIFGAASTSLIGAGLTIASSLIVFSGALQFAWFLIDESVALTLAVQERPAMTLVGSGFLFYFAWFVGTLIGTLGASLPQFGSVAEAIFPVLFVGLASISADRRDLKVRALSAAAISAILVGRRVEWLPTQEDLRTIQSSP